MSDTYSDNDDFQATQTATQPTGSQRPSQSQEPVQDHWGLLLNITTLPKERSSSQLQPFTDRVNYKLANDTPVYLLGRQKKAQIVFRELRVSNNHCRITRDTSDLNNPIVYIEDLGSSNGTWLKGERLVKKRKKVLTHGDEIELGTSSKHSGAASSAGGVKLVFHKAEKWAETEGKCEVFDYYHILGSLGAGTFADVKKAITLEGGEIVAIKEIQKHKFLANPKTLKLFEREIDILEKLTHPHICQFKEFFEDERVIYLILEYVDGGNLLEYIMGKEEGALLEPEAISITRQICEAMAYTHRKGVTHRDLKPENVLLTLDEPRQVKIADFGLAKMCDNSGTYLKSMVGTPQYLAPEVVLHPAGVGYDDAVDSWSVGIIVYAMLTKLLPFTEESGDPIEVRLKKRQMDRIDFSPFAEMGVTDIAKDFVDRLLSKDPKSRLSLEAALTHPWLRQPTSLGAHTSLAGDDSFVSSNSFDNTTIGTRVGTEVAPEEIVLRLVTDEDDDVHNHVNLNVNGNGLAVKQESGASMSAVSDSESFSQPFSQLALSRDHQAPPPAVTHSPLDSQFSLDSNEGSWGGGGRMEVDDAPKHSDGEGFNILLPPLNPQVHALGIPPRPVYHPPIARPRAPPSPALPPPPPPPQQANPPMPTPKRKRSATPDERDYHDDEQQQRRSHRDRTLLGSPAPAARLDSSSSLSDPPTSPKPQEAEQPSPVKRSERIKAKTAAASPTAATTTTPAKRRRKVGAASGSPEQSTGGVGEENPAKGRRRSGRRS